MNTTAKLAEFATSLRYEDIPAGVRNNACLAILDSIGTAFTGLAQHSVRIVRDAALHEGGKGQATIIGTGLQASATTAALANGTAAHALDYDSISLAVSGFISSPVLFAILALAENATRPVSGKRLIEAYVAGWEVEAAIARGLGVIHYTKGWHSTATLGHFGAVIGGARLLGLDIDATRSAMGIAASEASGLRTMIGNMTNPFHVGKAARNGVFAAQMARAGFLAEPGVIEHPAGFAAAFNGTDNFDLNAMTAGLGSRWDLFDPGLVIKVYPCCGLIHSALDAVLGLREDEKVSADAVAAATVAVHAYVPLTMTYPRPTTGYEAKFSTPFCVATALREGSVRLDHFTDERTAEPGMIDLMKRVQMVTHPDLKDQSTFLEREFSEVTLELKDGRRLTRRVNRINNHGSRGRPADLELIRRKFDDCTAQVEDKSRVADGFTRFARLAEIDDIRETIKMFR